MSSKRIGPTGKSKAKGNNNSTSNITRKIDTTQGFPQLLYIMTCGYSEGGLEFCQRYPTIEQYTWLQKFVDMTFGGAWVYIDDNVISIWFGSDWEWAVRIASEIAKQNGWAFGHDKSKRRFKFGRAYPKDLRRSTSDPNVLDTKSQAQCAR